MSKTSQELAQEFKIISAIADESVAPFANYHYPQIPTEGEYFNACRRVLAQAPADMSFTSPNLFPVLVKNDLIIESLSRYRVGKLNHSNIGNSFEKAMISSLLSDIYFLTGKAMQAVSRNKETRSVGDCLIFPLLRSLHWAAAERIGWNYKVDNKMKHDSDHADIYFQNILRTGLGQHGYLVDTNERSVVPYLVYLHDDKQTEALKVHIEGGLLKIWDPSINSLVPLHTEPWMSDPDPGKDASMMAVTSSSQISSRPFMLDNNTAHERQIHDNRTITVLTGNSDDDDDDEVNEVHIPGNFGVAGYVMSIKREIYATKHHNVAVEKGRFYHSSYLAGNDVICAGCMKVKNGKLLWIDNRSGHYQPSVEKLVIVLQTLRAQGVNITDDIIVHSYNPNGYYSAKYLLNNLNYIGRIHDVILPVHKAGQVQAALQKYDSRWFKSVRMSSRSERAYKKLASRSGASLIELAIYYAYMPFIVGVEDWSVLKSKQNYLNHQQWTYLENLGKRHEMNNFLDPLNPDSTLKEALRKVLGKKMSDAVTFNNS